MNHNRFNEGIPKIHLTQIRPHRLVRHAFAFEPDQRNIPHLKVNAESCGNISVIEMAVASATGDAYFSTEGSSATSKLTENSDGHSVKVSAISVDDFADTNPQLDVGLIKTDAEGYDLDVLLGSRKTISRFRPLILTECPFGKPLWDFLDEIGYGAFAFTRPSDRPWHKARMEEIILGRADYKYMKMIFLVPPHLTEKFYSLCRNEIF
jgi:FkbM family methyltransferase